MQKKKDLRCHKAIKSGSGGWIWTNDPAERDYEPDALMPFKPCTRIKPIAVFLTPLLYVLHFFIDRYLGKELSEKLIEEAAKSSR